MLGLAEEVETAIAEAVKGLRACGYSWAKIELPASVPAATKQRWGASS